MGITGLLPFLEKATKTCHISEFRGGTVAVDAYCLLHKGTSTCVEQLARGEDTRLYVDYCMKYVKMFISFDIHPIMVFDGKSLPAKAETEAKRRENRKKAKQRAAELLALGKHEEARTYLKQCIDVTPKMANNLIKECRKLKVDCIVAPYEADAQLAFFNINEFADCVITEDSDLILFGCKKVIYKLDLGGAGRLFESEKIPNAINMRPDRYTFDRFRHMCILSGCDYLNRLSGVGLKKAEKFIKLTVETNPEIFLDRIPRYLKIKHLVITEDYKIQFQIADATFLHQVVFDPFNKRLVYLTDPEICGTDPKFLVNAGSMFDDDKALQVAMGNLNPYDYQKYDDWVPEESQLPNYSIWSSKFTKRISRKRENELQRSRMQKFFAKKSEIEIPNKSEDILKEEDDLIDEELSMYTRKIGTRKIATEEEKTITPSVSPQLEMKQRRMSPPLLTNPFLKKKGLSKFPKTFKYGNTVVRSRFFSSEYKTCIAESDSKEFHQSKSENRSGAIDTSGQQDGSHYISGQVEEKTEILRSCENLLDSAKKAAVKNLDDDLKKEPEAQSTPTSSLVLEEVEVVTARETEIVDLFKGSDTEEVIVVCDLFDFSHEEPISGKRKIEPSESQGVSKKPAIQRSLHSFFPTLKKS